MNTQNNIEVEAKILEVSHRDLEKDIFRLGGKKIFDGELDARWFEDENGKRVRIRKEGDKVMTEYKKIIGDNEAFKKCIEIGSECVNFQDQINLFEALGYEQISKSIKRRVSYLIKEDASFGNVQLDFDKYFDLDGMRIPELLEIEASSGDIILKVAEVLGFKEEDLKNWNAGELAENYSKIHNK